MRRTVLAVAVASILGLTSVSTGAAVSASPEPESGPPDSYVAAWDATGSQAFTAAGLSPAEGHVLFGYVAIAVYDAVMAVDGGYVPFAVDENAQEDASPQAAVAAAAHRVLVHYLPAQQAGILDPAYAASLATIPDGQAKGDGMALGEQVALAVIAQRATDGFRSTGYPYTAPTPPVPGAWLPTAASLPIGTYLGHMQPFTLKSADQFRPAGPPALGSKRWARDFNEVKDVGSSASTTRTAEQTVAARFWAEPPVQQARSSFRRFITVHQLDIADAARYMAMVSVSYADAMIACFEAKYHYAFWRPITAVRAGDTDGNDATVGDPGWAPLLAATPNHPEYPSAHSCITPIGGIVASRFLDSNRIDFTVPSLTGLGDRTFATTADLRYDVMNGRIWGGIHYRSSVEDGSDIAKRTANWVLAHNFKAVDE